MPAPGRREARQIGFACPHASELIAEATLGRSLESTVEWMAHAIHPHPTLSEAIGRPLHI